ncbi:hypothetical protein BE20_55845 [Sorangium cellulosum]|uniref:Uncharacterized protein n=1 Tax=Sorangium cellulosum TaxID=56 RepID=A0A150T6T4_SORCE|nr:hypothetical protein BE18_01730 [Sorangium cellulosum]KYG00370.1 hypothetical protein BE20_55845 [Sorangium cellulosum]
MLVPSLVDHEHEILFPVVCISDGRAVGADDADHLMIPTIDELCGPAVRVDDAGEVAVRIVVVSNDAAPRVPYGAKPAALIMELAHL